MHVENLSVILSVLLYVRYKSSTNTLTLLIYSIQHCVTCNTHRVSATFSQCSAWSRATASALRSRAISSRFPSPSSSSSSAAVAGTTAGAVDVALGQAATRLVVAPVHAVDGMAPFALGQQHGPRATLASRHAQGATPAGVVVAASGTVDRVPTSAGRQVPFTGHGKTSTAEADNADETLVLGRCVCQPRRHVNGGTCQQGPAQ